MGKKMWCRHTMKHCPATKNKGILPFVTAQRDLQAPSMISWIRGILKQQQQQQQHTKPQNWIIIETGQIGGWQRWGVWVGEMGQKVQTYSY